MPEEEQKLVSFSFKTGELSVLTHISPVLHIRLGINPERAESKDDKFRLYSSDGKYDEVLTVKDDKVDGDEFVDLVYENLKVSQAYTLEIDPGAQGDKYNLFEEVPYQELIDFYSELEPGDELEDVEDDEEEDEDSDTQEDSSEPDWEDEEDGGGEYGGDPDDDDTQMEKILESEEPEEDDEIDWETVEPGRTVTQSEDEEEEDEDSEDAELPDMADWDKN